MVNAGTSSLATEDGESPDREADASPRPEWRSGLVPVATVLCFAIPALSYLWMIHAYGVNVIFVDQWDDVAMIGQAFSGTLHFSTLWAQHNENRIFFPNLIVLALAYTTHLNVVTEEYLSAFMAFGATALVISAHKRRSPGRRWIWYCPVAFLLLSLAQANNTLWGFQMAWYLVLLMVALALFLLDHEPPGRLVFGGAVAAAVVASFSSLQGLLVWPAGLLLLYLRRRSPHLVVAWIGSAVVAGVLYVIGYNFNTSSSTTPDPATALTFFVRVVGDIVGESQPGVLVTLFGSVLAVAAIWALVRFTIWGPTSTGGRAFALALILFGLLFSALTAYGRGVSGSNVEYRYTVFATFVLVGLYLVVLDPPPVSGSPSPERDGRSPATRREGHRHAFSDLLFTSTRVLVGVGIVVTVILGASNGISQARSIRQNDLLMGQITVRANQYPDPIVRSLYSWLESAQFIRPLVKIARDDHLSLFATGDAAKYVSEKPLKYAPFAPPRAALFLPHNGSTLHGKAVLDVITSDPFDITRIEYFLSGTGMANVPFARGVGTSYGWIAIWKTSSVPNGSYSIDATLSDSGGRSVTTTPVEVRVENVHHPDS